MRILGIDYGTKRIGVAIADTVVNLAFAREAIPSTPDAHKAIAKMFIEEQCDHVVVGYPLLEDGEVGEQARITDAFAESLRNEGIRVVLYDERFTTSAAQRNLEHVPIKKRKKSIDSEAARLMLAEYLVSLDSN